jgi:L-methionine (R)-S-oxide reductase
MHEVQTTAGLSKQAAYDLIARQLAALVEDERDGLANTANAAALLFESLPQLNWSGFYFLRGPDLVLGPFQGKVACVRIPMGRGVCGTAASERQTIVVPDVNAFPGHIACDTASRSEIVIPLILDGRTFGVLDVDSPIPARFDEVDSRGLERVAEILIAGSDWSWLAGR